MTVPIRIQSKTRAEIRQSIGGNLTDVIVSTASTTGASTSLVDTVGLFRGGDDEYNGRYVIIYEAAGSIAAGASAWVSDYASSSKNCTMSPAFAGSILIGAKYEMWKTFLPSEINDIINQAIMEVTDDCLQTKQISTTFTERDKYEYDCLASFVGVEKVEYVGSIEEGEVLDECEAVWDGAASVTVSLDDEVKREGAYCNKLDVASGVAAGSLLATQAITETDLSNYDMIEFWIKSSIAQTAGNLEFYLDDTAVCASPVDTMSLPALTANTWTRAQLTMANPRLDTAIICIGLGQKAATDVGACLIWLDSFRALKSSSQVFEELNPLQWGVVKGTTPYLKLTKIGLTVTEHPTLLRLTGYQKPSLLAADTTASEIEPAWLIAQATGRALIGHAKSTALDIHDRANLAKYWLGKAESMMTHIRTQIVSHCRWI